MSYQLPQELQTKKLNSLPSDLKAHAEKLIADKFGIGETISSPFGHESNERPSVHWRSPEMLDYQRNLLRINIATRLSQSWNMMFPISPGLIDSDSYLDIIVGKILKEMSSLETKYGQITAIQLEMNGNVDYANNTRDFREFIIDNYDNESGQDYVR